MLISTIDDNPYGLLTLKVCGNRIINDTSFFVKKHSEVALCNTWLTFTYCISNSRTLKQFDSITSSNDELAHVADIENGCT